MDTQTADCVVLECVERAEQLFLMESCRIDEAEYALTKMHMVIVIPPKASCEPNRVSVIENSEYSSDCNTA